MSQYRHEDGCDTIHVERIDVTDTPSYYDWDFPDQIHRIWTQDVLSKNICKHITTFQNAIRSREIMEFNNDSTLRLQRIRVNTETSSVQGELSVD